MGSVRDHYRYMYMAGTNVCREFHVKQNNQPTKQFTSLQPSLSICNKQSITFV